MKGLILAAGLGSRLMPLTSDRPKCMVEYSGLPLIDYQVKALIDNNIRDIAVVGGYKSDILREYLNKFNAKFNFFVNERFAETNMVYSLFCAREFMQNCNEELVITYSDIVYQPELIKKLKDTNSDMKICVDMRWLDLWSKRFNDPLSDAETLKFDGDFIIELGKKPKNLSDINAQYMGLFSFSALFLKKVIKTYDNLDKNAIYDGKNFENMYMTSFLQILIDKFHCALAIKNKLPWIEIDAASDLKIDIFDNY